MVLELVLKILFIILLIIIAKRIVKTEKHRQDEFFNTLHQVMISDLEKMVKGIKNRAKEEK